MLKPKIIINPYLPKDTIILSNNTPWPEKPSGAILQKINNEWMIITWPI